MIRVERVQQDIQAVARFTETPGAGASRPTFSRSWAAASEYIAGEARRIGCDVRVDAAGNLHARPSGLGWDRPAWLCGSHLDSVPHGGDYDGVAGVAAAIELLRSAAEDSVSAAVELIVFAEEEGTTFGLGMLGSRAWVGELGGAELGCVRNAGGQSYLEAGAPFGVDPKRLAADRIQPSHYLGLIEIHIEQGPGMRRRDQHLAVVRSIAGRIQYRGVVRGEANHAGATRMGDRRDALAGAAEIVLELERLAKRLSADAVVTVGRLTNHPNAINVIPDRVEFTIDLRTGDDATIAQADQSLRQSAAEICSTRRLQFELESTEAIAAAVAVVEQLVRRPTAAQLNELDQRQFISVCGGCFENSPWIAERAWKSRPFRSLGDLHEKLTAVLAQSSAEEKLSLLRAHPDLVGRLAREGKLTRESSAEQGAAGLATLDPDEVAAFESYNQQYRDEFGFPFIICARENRKEAILQAFPRRLANTRETELAAALGEICKIAQLRLADAIWEN